MNGRMLVGVGAFDGEIDVGRLDFQLLAYGPVRPVHSRVLLDTVVDWLRQHDYEVVVVDASWLIASHMFRDVGSALGYVCHDQWHCLEEALEEALAEVWGRAMGFALVLTSFDVFERGNRDDAHTLLEVFAERAWRGLLRGKRLLCLAQSDDLSLSLRRIGICSSVWLDQTYEPGPQKF
jgi:hypothetical protein